MTDTATERFPDPGAASFPQRFLTAARFAVGGVSYTLRHQGLWRLAAIPIALNIVLFGFFVVGGIFQIDDLVAMASLGIDPDAWYSFVETVWAALVTLASFVGVLLGGFLLTVVVGNVLAGPIYDLLSERTEVLVLGRSAAEPFTIKGFMGDLAQELVLMVIRLAVYLAGLLAIFLFGLVPAIGTAAAPVLSSAWSWLFLCLELHNAALARHKVKGPERLRHLLRHVGGHLGFGGASWLMMWVPVMMPFLVVGATRHHLALAAWDQAPSKLTDEDKASLRAERSANTG